ncbi:hypothetical protein HOY34_13020 [Xinfangfangia sp. D13-10-4-6]|uniref:hypothetical protein n=1 Tax=Pseudogemmobacter hezensis TaxID=2737662 RepID=UPI0015550237|nr:hypothetical protein [Pseudogemmobacter hezensis]NPD16120.1 hypothetical protein [Pseudogemmobacter hezensis]
MADTLQIITLYVTAGGVATVPVQGGHVTCRVTLGHISAEDGLLSELEGGAERLPWASKQSKLEAAEVIRSRDSLDGLMKEKLLRLLAQASFYDPGIGVD